MSNVYNIFREGLYRSLQPVLNRCSREQLIFADQNGPRPKGAFTTIKILSMDSETEERYDYQNAYIELSVRSTVSVSMVLFGPNSVQDAFNLKRKIMIKSFKNELYILFKELGLSVDLVSVGDVQDISQVIRSDFEQRSNIDLVFYIADEIIDKGYTDETESESNGGNYNINELIITGDYADAEDDTNIVRTVTKII